MNEILHKSCSKWRSTIGNVDMDIMSYLRKWINFSKLGLMESTCKVWGRPLAHSLACLTLLAALSELTHFTVLIRGHARTLAPELMGTS